MLIKYGLPLVALAMLAFAIKYLSEARTVVPEIPPPVMPAKNPFPNTVAGAGIIEPETQNIAMGSPVPGVVVEVVVEVGQKVKAGDPLFRLDDRQQQAELQVRRSMLADAQAQLARLDALPRPEELPPAETRVREAEADLANMRQQLARTEALIERLPSATSEEELLDRRQLALQAQERYNRAVAELELMQAGSWEFDKRIARAEVEQAATQVNQAEVELSRLVVRALVDSEVLQVNVRPGEFVGAPSSQALVVLGDVERLHVRVDIDEYDIPRFIPTADARASLKGRPEVSFPLEFVRIEPYVIPKRSLTGDNTERVDTRVLQVIYAISSDRRLFVGQQLDVFIDASPPQPAQ